MSPRNITIALTSGLIVVVYILLSTRLTPSSPTTTITNTTVNTPPPATPTDTVPTPPEPTNTNIAETTLTASVVIPIVDFFNRITKKPFGIYITPKTSPVQPEKFTGYHTGADAEATADEKDIDIPIYAVTDGTLVFAGHVNGYGGVILIRHKVGTETVTALYGHLRISSFTKKNGASVKRGDKIAVLGTGFSSETDGERKHLHFGIIKGSTINYKGYVSTKSALSAWEDPVAWLQAKGV